MSLFPNYQMLKNFTSKYFFAMETKDLYKEFYSDKTIDELRFNLTFYKSQLESLKEELEFFKHLMNAHIYKQRVPNLFEIFELFKKQIDTKIKLQSKLLKEIERQYKEVQLKLECNEVSCDDYFDRNHYELELDLVNFLIKTAKLKSEIMEFLKSIIVSY